MTKDFSFQPSLSGENISFRPLREDDFESIFSCASDKKIWEGHPAKDRYKESEFKKWFASAMEVGTVIVILDNKSNEIIGSSRFYVESSTPHDIAIGFTFLAVKYWGGKTNYKVKKMMLDYAFEYFNVVWFHISPSNIRSQKATQKIGGVLVDQKDSDLSGKLEPWLFYKIEKEDWLNR